MVHPRRASAISRLASPSRNNRTTMANQNAHLSLAELERIAEKILKLSAAEETEVDVSAATDALTRFANNTIHQNLAPRPRQGRYPRVQNGGQAQADRRWHFCQWLGQLRDGEFQGPSRAL